MAVLCEKCGCERKASPTTNLGRSKFCRMCGIKEYWEKQPKNRSHEDKLQYRREYYQKNRMVLDDYRSIKRRQARLDLLKLLGGSCEHCGIDDEVVLNVDHVNDDAFGNHSHTGETILRRIKKGIDDAGRYQILCCNCNWRKEYLRRQHACEK